jgi:hypothetical protein
VITRPQANVAKIDWDRLEGHNYSLQWSGTLDGFTPVPAERLVGGNGSEVNVEGMPRMFFRVEVSRE